jgi:hypothetical protein
MKKISIAFVFSVLIIMNSCGGTKNNDSQNSDSAKKVDSVHDSVAVIKPIDTISIAEHLGGDTIDPKNESLVLFSYNSSLAKHNKRLMTSKEVRKNLNPLLCGDEKFIPYTFSRYLFLDSLKKAKGELNPDIGDLVDVKIYFLDSIHLSKNFTAICWSMFFESYQACPYSTGTDYLVTTFDASGKQIATTLLGEHSFGADAPMQWSSDKTANIFKDGSFKEISIDTTQEDPDSTAQVEVKVYRGKINVDGKILKELLPEEKKAKKKK